MRGNRAVLFMALLLMFSMGFIGFADTAKAEPGGTVYIVAKDGMGNTSSINEAISWADDGDTIRVWEGAYSGQVLVNKELTIIGNGSGNTSLQHTQTVVVDIISNNVTFSGFRIESTADWVTGIQISGVNSCVVEGLEVETRFPMKIDRSKNVTVVNSSFTRLPNQTSVYSLPGDIELNQAEGVNLSGNILSRGISFHPSSDLPEHWDTHEIDGTNTINGQPVRYYKNLNEDEIEGAGGQLILGNCRLTTVQGFNIVNTYAGIIIGMGDNNTVSDGTLSAFDYGIMLINTFDNTVTGHTIDDGMTGVYMMGGSGNVFEHSFVSNTHRGVDIGHWTENNTVQHNQFTMNGYGTYIYGSDNNRILNNTYNENIYHGMQLDGQSEGPLFSNNTLIEGNSFIGNTYNGIVISYSNYNKILNNTMSENGRFGISFDYSTVGAGSNHNRIQGNTIENHEAGIFFWGSSYNEICYNSISNNINGIVMDSSDGVGASNNSVFNNTFMTNGHQLTFHAAINLNFDSRDIDIRNNNFHEELNAVISHSNERIYVIDNVMHSVTTAVRLGEDSSNFSIIDNIISGVNKEGTAIIIGGYGDNTIRGNSINGFNIGASIYLSHRNQLENNTFIDNNYGAKVSNSNDNRFIGNNFSDSRYHGVEFSESSRIIFNNNTVSENGHYGILVTGGSDNDFSYNEINAHNKSSWHLGIYYIGTGLELRGTNSLLASHNNISGNSRSINIQLSDNADINNNTVSDANLGIRISDSFSMSLSDNVLSSVDYGLMTFSSDDILISSNVFEGSSGGIYVYESMNVRIIDNDLNGSIQVGIYVTESYNISIDGNRISNSHQDAIQISMGSALVTVTDNVLIDIDGYGLILQESSDITIERNVFQNGSDADVVFFLSESVTMRDNTMVWGIGFLDEVSALTLATHDIDDSNTARGRPIAYLVGVHGGTVDSDVSQVFLVGCSSITIQGHDLNNVHTAMLVVSSVDITIADNLIRDNLADGIGVWESEECTITNNTILSNSGDGIFLAASSSNIISYNTVSGHYDVQSGGAGIRLDEGGQSIQSNGNQVFRNQLSDNYYGIITTGQQNLFYNNNLINNTCNGNDFGDNLWFAEFPTGGNYWSDHIAEDEDMDGFGDSPYGIWMGAEDPLPLMQPWFLDNEAPIAEAGPDQSVGRDATITFNGTGSSDNVGVVNYTWVFMDGGENVYLYGSIVSCVFQNVGVYEVTLNVTDAAGNRDSDRLNVTVYNVWAPVISPEPIVGQEAFPYRHSIIANESVTWYHAHDLPSSFTISVDNRHLNITGSPIVGEAGKYWINLTATSIAGESETTLNWTIFITDAWVPSFETSHELGQETVPFIYKAVANETVEWMIEHNMPFSIAHAVNETAIRLDGVPEIGDEGTYWINISAYSIAGGLMSYDNRSISIMHSWAPYFDPIPMPGQVSAPYSHIMNSNESVTWSISHNLPGSLMVVSNQTVIDISGIPQEGDDGIYWLNITATSIDGKLSLNRNHSLSIIPLWAPSITSGPPSPPAHGYLNGHIFLHLFTVNESCTFTMQTNATFRILMIGDSTSQALMANLEDGEFYINMTATSVDGRSSSYQNISIHVHDLILVKGTVRDSQGNPVPGALVMVEGQIVATTDGNGDYLFSVAEGNHTLMVVKDGFVFQSIDLQAQSGVVAELGETSPTSEGTMATQDMDIMYVAAALTIGVILGVLVAVVLMKKP